MRGVLDGQLVLPVLRSSRRSRDRKELPMHPLPTALASMGLLMLLSGCATNYDDRSTAQGYKSGSPEFAKGVEADQEGPVRIRRRHCPLCKSGQGR